MTDIIKNVTDLLPSEVWAIYIIGFVGIGVTIWQLERTFVLRKKSETFDKLSKEIQEASDLYRRIDGSTEIMMTDLAVAADDMKFDPSNKTEEELRIEEERRKLIIEELQEKYRTYKIEIESNTLKVLEIIKNIEKSTIVKEKTRVAARYLYFAVDDQHKLTKSGNSVLETINVVPPLGDIPNVTPDSFKAIKALLLIISGRNQDIGGYLDDLEIILHNDLTKRLYGRATNETLPDRHLTTKGVTDKRSNKPLL